MTCAQETPFRQGEKSLRLCRGAIKSVTARRDNHDIRIGGDDRIERHGVRMFAGLCEHIDSAGAMDHFRHPMAAGKDGVTPFDECHPGTRGARFFQRVVNGAQPATKAGN